jgi:hypothetical protein
MSRRFLYDLRHSDGLANMMMVVQVTKRGLEMTRLFQIAALVTLVFIGENFEAGATYAADLPLISGQARTQTPGSSAPKVNVEMRLEDFARGPNAACTAWTDGCRACGRSPDGVFCSNVGFACQASEPRCTRP